MCTVPLIRQLYCCDIIDIRRVPPERATCIHKINETFEKSDLLIGLFKFAQTFAVRFLKSSSFHPICINAWGSFSFKIGDEFHYLLVQLSLRRENYI